LRRFCRGYQDKLAQARNSTAQRQLQPKDYRFQRRMSADTLAGELQLLQPHLDAFMHRVSQFLPAGVAPTPQLQAAQGGSESDLFHETLVEWLLQLSGRATEAPGLPGSLESELHAALAGTLTQRSSLAIDVLYYLGAPEVDRCLREFPPPSQEKIKLLATLRNKTARCSHQMKNPVHA